MVPKRIPMAAPVLFVPQLLKRGNVPFGFQKVDNPATNYSVQSLTALDSGRAALHNGGLITHSGNTEALRPLESGWPPNAQWVTRKRKVVSIFR